MNKQTDISPAGLKALMPQLLETTLEAGQLVMDVFHSDFKVFGKADTSPVTEADRRGEQHITEALMRITPDIPIVGEEAKSEGQCPDVSGGIFWLVDPLDGTKEFVKKGNDFTVNLGLIADGEPIAGIVLAPALNTLYWGIRNLGAYRADIEDDQIVNERAMRVRIADPNRLTIVASKSHRSPELETWLSHFSNAENVSIGSSLKLCQVAAGEADLYPRLGPTCEWDTAAAHGVLLAAGGSVEVAGGFPLTYGKDLSTFLNPWFLCKGDVRLKLPSL